MERMKWMATLLLVVWCVGAVAQNTSKTTTQRPSFVDGYHGGIYGHYPVEWKTRFMCETLERNPEWRMSLEIEPETWDSVALLTPADYERFKQIAASPRVEFTNPAYAQPYCYNISGESIIRQMQYGMRKIWEHFPDVEFLSYAVEEPCFTSALPQILSGFGYKYATLKCPNTCWGGYTAPYGGELVNWISADGSSLLTSPRHACEELYPKSVWQTMSWGNEKEYLDACREAGIEHPIGMTLQDAGWKGGPWIGRGNNTRGNSRYVTWREYFEGLGIERADDDYHFSQEEVRPALMWGSQVLQRIAQLVRRGENDLLQSEQIASMAYLQKGVLPDQAAIDEAWRVLMLSQHHDSWIVPYNRLNERGTWAENIDDWCATTCQNAAAVQQQAMGVLAASGATEKEAYFRVYNTQPFARREVVRVALPEGWNGGVTAKGADGEAVECEADGDEALVMVSVPAFGYGSFSLQRVAENVASAENKNNLKIIENDLYRIEVDVLRGGVIKHLYVREGRRWVDYVDADSEFGLGELRGHFYRNGGFRSSMERTAEVEVVRHGDLEQSLIIKGMIAAHPFTQRITLRKGDERIDMAVEIDWQHNEGIGEYYQKDAFSANARACYDDSYKLSLMLPVALGDVVLDKNAPYDVCRSTLENTHFKRWDEIKHNIILNWVDVVGKRGAQRGLALLSDHTTSYRHGEGEPLGLTIQYSGSGLWGREYGVKGRTEVRCALIPHRKAWDEAGLERANACWNAPLQVAACSAADMGEKSYLDVGASGYILSAAYPTAEGVIVRLYNAEGDAKPVAVRLSADVKSAREVNLLGEKTADVALQAAGEGREMMISAPRFGFKTILLERK